MAKTLTQRLKTAIALAGLNLSSIFGSNENASLDVGVAEQTIDPKTREILKTIRREPYSDTTFITEKGEDGKMHSYTETSVRQADGSYKIVIDAPRVWAFQPR